MAAAGQQAGGVEKLAFKKEGQIAKPALTPVLADAVWVDAWPKADDKPSFNPYYGWNDGGMGRFLIARHASGASVARQTQSNKVGLFGGINITFSDGHVATTRLRQLWQLSWHQNYVPPAKPPF